MDSVYSSFHLHYVSEVYHYCCLWLQINENHLFSLLPSIPLWPFMYTTVSCFHSPLPSFQAVSYMEVRRKFVCVKGGVCLIFLLPLKSPHVKETKKPWSCLLVSTSRFQRQPSRYLLRILGISELLQLWAASGISRPVSGAYGPGSAGTPRIQEPVEAMISCLGVLTLAWKEKKRKLSCLTTRT